MIRRGGPDAIFGALNLQGLIMKLTKQEIEHFKEVDSRLGALERSLNDLQSRHATEKCINRIQSLSKQIELIEAREIPREMSDKYKHWHYLKYLRAIGKRRT